MTTEQFKQYMGNPAGLDKQSLNDLEQAVKAFPYCAALHLLETKNHENLKSIYYAESLKKTSLIAPNRVRLYDLISQKEKQPVKVTEPAKEVPATMPKPAPSLPTLDITTRSEGPGEKKQTETAEKTPEITPAVPAPTDKTTGPVAEKTPVPDIPPAEIHPVKEVTSQRTDEPASPPGEEIPAITTPLSEIAQKLVSIPEPPISEPKKAPSLEEIIEREREKNLDNVEKEILSEVISEFLPDTLDKKVAEPILKDEEPETEEPVSDVPRSFTEWLKSGTTFPAGGNEVENKDSSPENRAKKKEIREKQSELIEKIISEEPRISKPSKTEFFSPQAYAKESVKEDETLVTETLAKIYALQGSTQKAIKAYQALSLKFPEKSSYFATLIDELKEKQKK